MSSLIKDASLESFGRQGYNRNDEEGGIYVCARWIYVSFVVVQIADSRSNGGISYFSFILSTSVGEQKL